MCVCVCVCVCVFVRVGGWACACVGGERFSNSNRIIPSDYRILLLLKMPIPSSYHVQGPERYQKHRQNCPCNISGSTVMSYLWMNGWQRSAFSFSTHTHTEARVMSQGGHKHTHNISRTALSHFMSVSQFHLTKTILISYTHRNVKVFTATRQNKSSDFVKTLQ